MSIPITNIVKNASGSWTFFWTQIASFYRVVLWGQQLTQTTLQSYTWLGLEYRVFPPPLEIAAGSTLTLSETYVPYLVMQWYGEPVREYLIQKLVVSSWGTIATFQEVGDWLYTYTTPTLADETIYQYRVIAVDSVGNQSTPRLYTRYVVTPPIPPDGKVKITYTNPNAIISAA